MDTLASSWPTAATSTEQNLPADNNTCTPDCYLKQFLDKRFHVAIIASRLPLSLLLIVFASLTILVTRRTARLTERPSATLITNLGVTGALIGGIIFVFTVLLLFMKVPLPMVKIIGVLLPRILHIVITLTLAWVALDRYLAICRPLRYPALMTESSCFLLVVASWVIPFLFLGLPWAFINVVSPCTNVRPYMVIYLILFTSAIFAIVVMYFLIAREFRRPVESNVWREEMVAVRRRTAKELMVVVMVNLLLATPDVTMKLYLLNCPTSLPALYQVVPQLLLIHLICFYPLYAWKNLDFRKGMIDTFASYKKSFTKTLRKICCRFSFCQVSFVRISFAKISTSSSSTVSSGVVHDTTTTTTTTTNNTTNNTTIKMSTSSSTLPSVSLPPSPPGKDNVVFYT